MIDDLRCPGFPFGLTVTAQAVDQYGQVIDVLVSIRRDAEAARRFFRRALAALKVTPTEVVTDAAPALGRPEPRKGGAMSNLTCMPTVDGCGFPDDFIWGTGASATQAEGASPYSDWWAWERDGRAPQSGSGNGFGNRYAEDFALFAEWGLRHHRLSLDWSRLQPTQDHWDKNAVEHYRAILQAGRDAGLTVWACLLHGALPAWFAAEGGFLSPDATTTWRRWVEFAATTFGDLVGGWKPVNGPASLVTKQYLTGQFPPGLTDRRAFGQALRVIQQADFDAARWLRSTGYPIASVEALAPIVPRTPAAQPAATGYDAVLWDSWLSLARSDEYADAFDYIGFSYYFAVEIDEHGRPGPYPAGEAVGPQGYVPWPDGLRLVLDRLAKELPGRRLVVSELGYGGSDDAARIGYLSRCLRHVDEAMRDGVDVAGVFLWTGVDNYEWTDGYDVPYGLFTSEREPRPSADLIRQIIHRTQ